MVEGLLAWIEELERREAKHLRRIDELESRLKRDSRNSSRPPSSDPAWPKRRRGRRPRSGRKQGGQPGHEGTARELVDPSNVDETKDHRPDLCDACGHDDLEQGIGDPYRHQVTVLPRVLVTVREHRLHKARCRRCRAVTTAVLPDGVPTGAFGPRLTTLAGALRGVYRVSVRETQRLLGEIFGVKMSLGKISDCERRLSDALHSSYLEALGAVRTSLRANVDETSWKERGRVCWLWAAESEHATAFGIDRRRSAKAKGRLIGRRFGGTVISDRMGAYESHPLARRQLCWAHIERAFRALAEGPRGHRRFGNKGVMIAQSVMRSYRLFGEHGDRDRLQGEAAVLRGRLERLIANDDSALANHLRPRVVALFTYARTQDVSPTNNAAERAVRKAVLWRKGSFGSQSARGLRFAERVLTAAATLRRRGDQVFDFLADSVAAHLTGADPPVMVPLPLAR